MIKRKSKKAFDLPFSWIFAIIAGGFIIFLAIYATTQFIEVAKYRQYTEAAKSITALIDPMETGIASAVGDIIRFNVDTRTYYNCYAPDSSSAFGKQTIAFSEQSGLGKKWQAPGGEITIANKFIFSDELEEGTDLYLFSKPLYAGFKVTDMIFASSKKYCFIAPPNDIKEELELLTLANINLSDTIEDCFAESLKVCFDALGDKCDIIVMGDENAGSGYVSKGGEKVYYSGNLIYAAILASPRIYECNIQRLAKKTSELAMVYRNKADIVALKGCDSPIRSYLDELSSINVNSSASFVDMFSTAQLMDNENKIADCKLYAGETY